MTMWYVELEKVFFNENGYKLMQSIQNQFGEETYIKWRWVVGKYPVFIFDDEHVVTMFGLMYGQHIIKVYKK